MYLDYLKENEKKAFIILAVKAAMVNGVVEDEEKELINEYCYEMKLEYLYDDILADISMEDLFSEIVDMDNRNKRIVLFEIICLLHVDGTYDEEEKAFVNEISQRLGFDEEEVLLMVDVVKQYIDVVSSVGVFVLSEEEL